MAATGAVGGLADAVASLAALLEPHFAAEEAHLVPVLRAAIAERAGGGPPPPPPARGGGEEDEQAVPDDYGIPFAVEHLEPAVRAVALPRFPRPLDAATVDTWLEAYQADVARWTG